MVSVQGFAVLKEIKRDFEEVFLFLATYKTRSTETYLNYDQNLVAYKLKDTPNILFKCSKAIIS